MSAANIIAASRTLAHACEELRFAAPVTHIYNPLIYARAPFEDYVQRYGDGDKRVLFLGMNPGPWGMAQTGIPFGEVRAVHKWLQLRGVVNKPPDEHPKRPVQGFDCRRSEVSGKRLWAIFADKFANAEEFFAGHFVLNYCPLLFLSAINNRCTNLTPDKLPANETAPLFALCDTFLRTAVTEMRPQHLIGIGAFAESRLRIIFGNGDDGNDNPTIGKILHPSPASPAANRGFQSAAEKQLQDIGVWRS